MIDADRASLAEISAAISIFPQTFTQTLSESLRESRPIVSEFVVHRFSAAYRLRLLTATVAGLTERLQAIGADPGGVANPYDTKNPKSPDCDFRILNETHMPRLNQYLARLRMSVEPIVIAKRMALMQLRVADFDDDQSNDLWTWAKQATWETGKLIDANGGSALSSFPTPDQMVDFKYQIIEQLTPEAEKIYDMQRPATKRAVVKIFEQTAWFVATHIRKGEPGVRRGRRIGAASHVVEQRLSDGTESTNAEAITAAQSAGGAFSSMNQRARSLDEITKAVAAIMVTGGRVTQAAIVRATGKSERTVRAYWPAPLSGPASWAGEEELAPEPAKQSQRRRKSGRTQEIPAQTAKLTPPRPLPEDGRIRPPRPNHLPSSSVSSRSSPATT
jgi:hypothetical protein